MAYYRDKVNKLNLIDTLVQKLTAIPAGATVPYWTQVQSGTFAQEGYVLHSKGSSGNDDIYVRINTATYGITLSIIEQYIPNPVSGLIGSAVNESVKQAVQYFASGSYLDTAPVNYLLSFDKDKIILALRGNSVANSTSVRTLAYAGLPERLDPKDDSTAVILAVSRWAYQLTSWSNGYEGPASQCKVLKARDKSTQSIMQMINLSNWKTKGWNNTILLSQIYLQDDSGTEGIRSRMTSIHPINQDNVTYPDFRDGDEITVGSKRYIVFQVYEAKNWTVVADYDGTNSINCFPTPFMAIEEL